MRSFSTIGILGSLVLSFTILSACGEAPAKEVKEVAMNTSSPKAKPTPKKPLSEAFKKYWYAGNAEITSYQLEMARYGEIREGKAVMVYVTEPFAAGKQVKADRSNPSNIPVLKLNTTKKFLTGIYPYSIMTSSFYPVSNDQHAIKLTNSVQEWCGQVFAQLNNKEQFEVASFSYFESEGDHQFKLEKEVLENELWNQLRIDPKSLPMGEFKMIPSLEYIRLRHKEVKAYTATASIQERGPLSTYTIDYPELDRNLSITFSNAFPYTIESWTESYKSGFGPKAKILTNKATKINRIKSAYWGKNKNKDLHLRDSLGI
ncbi:septum formation inhibitor Maf [Spongiimicrobium salis]|uniref:septum formation inhibitor Maf n=1 Tax=Spongiimicrobium salis TaxID=1667022 RepID=UPI00374DB8B8